MNVLYLLRDILPIIVIVDLVKCRECIVKIGSNYEAIGVFNITSPHNIEYCSYLGISYAQPPLGHLRFEPPQPVIKKTTQSQIVYNKVSEVCTQYLWNLIGSEDCLYLNVYTPIGAEQNVTDTYQIKKPFPVFIWIHGGSYNFGSSGSDVNGPPEPIVEQNVIVVTMNYRLGVLGFLSMHDANITGNNGLKDQQLAMRWVKENIEWFGGDPNAITLVGWSAGSASVSFHLYEKSSSGLFDRAILMSGVFNNPWAYFDYPEFCVKQLFNDLNISEYKNDSIKLLLKSIEVDRLYRNYHVFEGFGFKHSCFIPTAETSDRFVIEPPTKLLQKQPINDVPIMIGYTVLEVEEHFNHHIRNGIFNQQFSFMYDKHNATTVKRRKLNDLIHKYLKHEFSDKLSRVKYENIPEYWKTDDWNSESNSIEVSSNETWKSVYFHFMSRLISVADIKYGTKRFFRAYRDNTQSQMFVYIFSYEGKYGHFKGQLYRNETRGAVHGDDLGYVFKPFYKLDDEIVEGVDSGMFLKNETFMQKNMVQMWTNFVKFGNPSMNDWPEYRSSNKILNIDLEMKLIEDDDNEFDKLWTKIEMCLNLSACEFLENFK